ncbi:glycoside hydrolase family 16 protein [Rhodococcus triatomae]
MSPRSTRAAGTTARPLRAAAAALAVAACAACTIPTNNPTGRAGATADPELCGERQVPGGVPVPTGDLSGWKQIFTDDFDRCDLGSDWGPYSGQPGGNPNSHWDRSMVEVSGGALTLKAERSAGEWVTGGVSNYPVTQQYGRWEIRMRADRSDDISYHMLLWPKSENWPPEIDFAESVSGERSQMDAWVHWVDSNGENKKAQATVRGDFSDWHTVGVEWGPGIIRYLRDGAVWAEVRSDAMIPDEPMWLGLQAEAGACERRADWGMAPCSDASPLQPDSVGVQIDWVAVYSPERSQPDATAPTPGAVQMTEDG